MGEAPGFDEARRALLVSGDEKAWEDFFAEYDPLIESVLRWPKWRFQQQVKEDVAQAIRVEIVKSMPKFAFQSSLALYIKRICIHRCVDEIRRQIRRRKLWETKSGHLERSQQSTNRDLQDMTDPVCAVMRAERDLALRDMLESMDAPCREVIKQFYFEGLSYKEIAEKQGISANSVGSRLNRCLRKLMERMEKEGLSRD